MRCGGRLVTKNEALAKLAGLVGSWTVTLTDAWFLESRDVRIGGSATFDWLDGAFLRLRWTMEDEEASWSELVIGHNDARERYVALSCDYRGVARAFDMTFEDGEWLMWREDPDFYQRWIATVEADRIVARPEASEDEGSTWRKDFDLIFERLAGA